MAHLRLVPKKETPERFPTGPVELPEPEAAPHPDLPGSRRRDWVYREMGLLGAEAFPWVEHLED